MTAEELIAQIKDKDDKVRAAAWIKADEVGAPAVKPLASAMTDGDFEVARAAKRGLWKIIRRAGRPGADEEKKAVVKELIPLTKDGQAVPVRRETMWMVSELAGDEAVAPVAAALTDKELREDARMVLERLPGDKSLAALKAGFEAAPEEFKPNMAHSLRVRGVPVSGYPSARMTANRKTTVEPLKEGEAPKQKRRAKAQ